MESTIFHFLLSYIQFKQIVRQQQANPTSLPALNYSKSTIETLEKYVEYVLN